MARQERDSTDHGEGDAKGSDSCSGTSVCKEIKEILDELKAIRKLIENSTKPKKKSIFDDTGTALRAPRGLR
jgi:hypothetical protein